MLYTYCRTFPKVQFLTILDYFKLTFKTMLVLIFCDHNLISYISLKKLFLTRKNTWSNSLKKFKNLTKLALSLTILANFIN